MKLEGFTVHDTGRRVPPYTHQKRLGLSKLKEDYTDNKIFSFVLAVFYHIQVSNFLKKKISHRP